MTIRIGIIGCGAIADYLHAPAIINSRDCELTALIDTDPERLKLLAQKFQVAESSKSIEDVCGAIDAVIVATPPHLRVAIAEQCLRLGLHVLCEKPFANTVAECEQIEQAGRENDRLVGVFHQFRFWPSRREVAKRIHDSPHPPVRVSVSQGNVYTWNSVSGYTVRGDMVPGGVLINAGTHPMDSLISWLGEPETFDYWDDSCGGLESNVKMTMSFDGGVSGEFRLSRTCRLENRIRLQMEDCEISVTNHDPFSITVKHSNGSSEIVDCGAHENGFLQPASDLYDNFASSIEGNAALEVDAHEGTRVIRWVEDCYRQKRRRPSMTTAPIPGMCW